MNSKQIHILCVKSVTGRISEEEKQLLKNWLADSEANRNEFEKIKTIWETTEAPEMPCVPNKDIEWNILSNKLNLESDMVDTQESFFSKIISFAKFIFAPKFRPAYYSAFAAILIVSAIFIFNSENTQLEWKTISTGNQENYELTLSDGSIVKLNSGSSIQFHEAFVGENREVKLRGEAFFSIQKDEKPFIVVTDNTTTRVLGTQFNVWTRGEKTKVIVKEGRVILVSNKSGNPGVILNKNNSATVIKDQIPNSPEVVNSDYLLGWLDGKIVFNQSTLKEVTAELERQYDIPITIAYDSLNSFSITGTFEDEKIEDILSMICLTLDIEFESQGDSFILK